MIYPLSIPKKIILSLLSFLMVAFGQPLHSLILNIIAASFGYVFFWRVLLSIENARTRFLLGFFGYTLVSMIQMSWFLSHPYGYIYGVWIFCACLTALPSGLISIFMVPSILKNISSLIALSALWTVFEWFRLFILSGLPFNPSGLALTAHITSLQFASIGGIYALSFWVILTNLLFLRVWIFPSIIRGIFLSLFALFPYGFGLVHLYYHTIQMNHSPQEKFSVLLVQPNFPTEENMSFHSANDLIVFAENEWNILIQTISSYDLGKISLIVFPENVVPFCAHTPIFPLEDIQKLFQKFYETPLFPPLLPPDCKEYLSARDFNYREKKWLVSNAFIAQTLANTLNSDVIIGLEHSEYCDAKRKKMYSSAFHFIPFATQLPQRYDKQILVPMGEYIPFDCVRHLAAMYGITGSFTPGKGTSVFQGKVPFGISICYEELYGNLIRENRQKGAHLLINLTNDGWYPNSQLPQQHLLHARLRTVENGFPLIRACNTGITVALDSLGRMIARLDENQTGALSIEVPLYHYTTLYSYFGDLPIIVFSFIFLLYSFIYNKTIHTT